MTHGDDPRSLGEILNSVGDLVRSNEGPRDTMDFGTERKLQRLASIPRRFASVSVADFPADVQRTVAEWLEDPMGEGLLICGPIGTGKTQLLWSMYAALAAIGGPRMRIVKTIRLFSDLKPHHDEAPDPLQAILTTPILALDDLGAERGTEWEQERMYEIVDTRYDDMMPIVVSTNKRPESLGNVVGERVASRLTEACRVLTLTGADRRKGASV